MTTRTYLPAAVVLALGLAGMVYLGIRDPKPPATRQAELVTPAESTEAARDPRTSPATVDGPARDEPTAAPSDRTSSGSPGDPVARRGPRDVKAELRAAGQLPELASPSVQRPSEAPRNVASGRGSGGASTPRAGSGPGASGSSPSGRRASGSSSPTSSGGAGAPAGSTFGAGPSAPEAPPPASSPPVNDPPSPGGSGGSGNGPPTRGPDDDSSNFGDDDPPEAPAIVQMIPSAESVLVGQAVTLSIEISSATDVGHVPFHVTFDPQVLSFESGVQGFFLSSDGWQTAFFASPTTQGNIVVVGLSRLGAVEGIDGGGVLCTLQFTAVGPGDARLGFQSAKVKDSQNSIVPSSFFAGRVVVE